MKPVKIIIGGVPEPMSALNKVKILENHEPLVDIRIACPLLTFPTDAGKADGMSPFLRQTVAEMLNVASERILKEYRLHAISAWRSSERQKEIWWSHYNRHKDQHPDWPEHSLRRAVNRYAAPVSHPAPPGHCTGGAVDVVLQKLDGSFVDLVPPDLSDWSLGHTWTNRVDPAIKATRMMLLETMSGVGFSNVRDEYWHYSYGDSGWAVRVGEKECPYGVANLPS
ncbi:MAG: M15 family metallopeptidase [bacterium]|nr:M15 family metallopeptidase [bacterium]